MNLSQYLNIMSMTVWLFRTVLSFDVIVFDLVDINFNAAVTTFENGFT